jgi:hypothetical protein
VLSISVVYFVGTSEVKSGIKVYSDSGGGGGGEPLLAPQIVCQFARVLQPEQK